MNQSLSVLLPVHNAQDRLEAQVSDALDVLPELTRSFDLLIIDDGSTDDTIEVAQRLATLYPQVNVVRHPIQLGLSEAIQTGLDHTDGEIVIVGDEHVGIHTRDLRELWKLREDSGQAGSRPAGSAASGDEAWIEKLLGWNRDRQLSPQRSSRPGLRVLRRPAGRRQLQPLHRPGVADLRRLDRGLPSPPKPAPPRRTFADQIVRFTLGE